MKKVILSNEFLSEAAEQLRKGISVRLRVDGQSMYPFIHGGQDEVDLIPYDGVTPPEPWCCPFYKWHGQYMIHRFIGVKDNKWRMLGDGNLCRVEEVPQSEIIGILRTIYYSDGTVLDCRNQKWLWKAAWWYRLRKFRRYLLRLCRIFRI